MFSENWGQVASLKDRITWIRASTQFSENKFWGNKGITTMDVRQGAVGNCWFMAASSALAEVPNRLERIFLKSSGSLSPNGIYGINLYTLGVPHTVIVDDYIPL